MTTLAPRCSRASASVRRLSVGKRKGEDPDLNAQTKPVAARASKASFVSSGPVKATWKEFAKKRRISLQTALPRQGIEAYLEVKAMGHGETRSASR